MNLQVPYKLSWSRHWIPRASKATEKYLNCFYINFASSGHTGAIRALCTMGNENSFVSSSKDKLVKLWSLRNQGDGTYKSQCRYTYAYHRKAVFAATFLEAPRLVATCDGVVHVRSNLIFNKYSL